jgi:hypothetical protein
MNKFTQLLHLQQVTHCIAIAALHKLRFRVSLLEGDSRSHCREANEIDLGK